MSRSIRLRTHVLFFMVMLVAFGLLSGLIYWSRSATDKAIETSILQNLRLLEALPDIRAQVRRMGDLEEVHRKTGDPAWLKLHGQARARAREAYRAIAGGNYAPVVSRPLARIEGLLKDPSHEPKGPPVTDASADVLELLSDVNDAAIANLKIDMDLFERASLTRFYIRTAAELCAVVMLTVYLLNFVLIPLRRFESAAREWKPGSEWDPHISAIPEIRGLSGMFSEMTRHLNDQFDHERKMNEFKSKLVSLVSHEFSNSLTVINNAVFLLEENVSPDERAATRPLHEMIASHANMLSSSVSNLLNMGRLESGKMAVDLRETRIGDILRGVIARLDLLAAQKHLSVILDLPAEPVAVKADGPTLSLVMSNLLSNAIKYTPEHGRIWLSVVPEDGSPGLCRVSIKDTGIGVTPAEAERILSGFYRTEGGKKMSAKGFGIGLSLARQIIEAHGSRLALESTPGKGTRISFVLPLWPGSRIGAAPPDPAPRPPTPG